MALKFATAGTVLLKNQDNILPINQKIVKTIAILGDDAHKNTIYAGGGYIIHIWKNLFFNFCLIITAYYFLSNVILDLI